MHDELHTFAEQQAKTAQQLDAFSRVNLLGIKKGAAHLLGLIGREGIFDEYTVHNISHIEKMLASLDWLIPEETKKIMTPADWLMTVLSIYFHDLGMLVSKREYEQRNSSGFREYVERELYSGDSGKDYRSKVELLPQEQQERFLYQEYVRHRHAERIKAWILGDAKDELGIAHGSIEAVQELLYPLTAQFRRDLALICESHHLDDLGDTKKYRLSQPYGDSDSETANLQYAAVVLRTSDLLHITSDRTPSIEFKAINPTDPISQEEWAKQMAVTRVRPQLAKDKEGNVNNLVAPDIVEVHAYFKDVRGFFGLTSYLSYVGQELKRSAGWIKSSDKLGAGKYKFPWRGVDDSFIETEGFLRNTFEFTLDQGKILDLLTGHTLYNESKVVVREICQNAIDAVRLKRFELGQEGRSDYTGKVRIIWEDTANTITVIDNGTGMTQGIIEAHLLRVGSSRYQDPDFQKAHPGFSSISRFGIGILSAFMIADEVEITTSHPDEEQARHLSLRSVHGRYLIRKLSKDSNLAAFGILPHGTSVKLRLRPSASLEEDLTKIVQHWIVIPDCDVTVESGTQITAVGFKSPREAVLDVCKRLQIEDRVKVRERSTEGITLAYATRWSDHFSEEEFEEISSYASDRLADHGAAMPPLGICIGGIRVDDMTPGFSERSLIAIANAQGPAAPKTNVARSELENTPERDALLRNIYTLYTDHVREQLKELHSRHGFSLTWAVQEARHLLRPLLYPRRRQSGPLGDESLKVVIKDLPIYLVEFGGTRSAISATQLQKHSAFWTIECNFFWSAELLIKELPSDTSLSDFAGLMKFSDFELPDGPVLCGQFQGALERMVLRSREVGEIHIDRKQRRVDLKWLRAENTPRWHWSGELRGSSTLSRPQQDIYVGRTAIPVEGLKDEIVIDTAGTYYVLADSEPAKALCKMMNSDLATVSADNDATLAALFDAFSLWLRLGGLSEGDRLTDDILGEGGPERRRSRYGSGVPKVKLLKDLIAVLVKYIPRSFSPSAWKRESIE